MKEAATERLEAWLEAAALAEGLCGDGTKTGIDEKTGADGTGDGRMSAMLEDESLAELDKTTEVDLAKGMEDAEEDAEEDGEEERERLGNGEDVATVPLEGGVVTTTEEATAENDVGRAVGVTVLVLHEVVAPLLILILSISIEPIAYKEPIGKQEAYISM